MKVLDWWTTSLLSVLHVTECFQTETENNEHHAPSLWCFCDFQNLLSYLLNFIPSVECFLSVLWHYCLGDQKDIQTVKKTFPLTLVWNSGTVVFCLLVTTCIITGNKQHWRKHKALIQPVSWPHPSFSRHRTPNGRGIGPFTPALWHCYPSSVLLL